MLPERLLVVGARNQMDKKTQAMITVIFLSWAFILIIVKHSNHNKDYIIPDEESSLTFIK
jgi:hypothetical protein